MRFRHLYLQTNKTPPLTKLPPALTATTYQLSVSPPRTPDGTTKAAMNTSELRTQCTTRSHLTFYNWGEESFFFPLGMSMMASPRKQENRQKNECSGAVATSRWNRKSCHFYHHTQQNVTLPNLNQADNLVFSRPRYRCNVIRWNLNDWRCFGAQTGYLPWNVTGRKKRWHPYFPSLWEEISGVSGREMTMVHRYVSPHAKWTRGRGTKQRFSTGRPAYTWNASSFIHEKGTFSWTRTPSMNPLHAFWLGKRPVSWEIAPLVQMEWRKRFQFLFKSGH